MFSFKYLRLISSFIGESMPDPDNIINDGVLGIRLAQEYATRFELLDVKKCLFLGDFYISNVERTSKHLVAILPNQAPIFSQMEYYDNDPFSYTAINYSYKGCLKDGTDIVIKVTDTNASKNFEKDLVRLRKAIKIISYFSKTLSKKIDGDNIILKIEQSSKEGLDLNYSINGTETLRKYASNHIGTMDLSRLRFTETFGYLSSDYMIVKKYVYGSSFRELIESNRLSYKDVIDVVRFQFFYIFIIGTFHKNLHFGNIIISDEGYLYFTDCNNIASIPEDFRGTLFKVLNYMTKKDYEKMGDSLIELSLTKTLDKRRTAVFKILLVRIFKNFEKYTISECSFCGKFMESLRQGYDLGLRFDPCIFSVIRAFLFIEDMVKISSPNAFFSEDVSRILDEVYLEQIKDNKTSSTGETTSVDQENK